MIEIKNLTKEYSKKLALDNVSFKVEKGEILGLLGPNGAGKTTTMNIMTGYISATSGSVTVDGYDILTSPMEAKKLIGYLPEIPPLYNDMTVKKYLGFIYDLKKVKLDKAQHLGEIMEDVKIADVQNRVIKNLSKGYKQRVGIAQALVGYPPVLILDEPTVGLDPAQIMEIRQLIKSLANEHTVIFSSHILSEVSAICDRVIVINKGKKITDLKTDDLSSAFNKAPKLLLEVEGDTNKVLDALKSAHGVVDVRVKEKVSDKVSLYVVEHSTKTDVKRSIFKTMADRDLPIFRMEKEEKSLEQLFLQLTGNDNSEFNDMQTVINKKSKKSEKKEG